MWVEIEPSTVKEDRRLEMLGIAEATSGLLDPLDDGVDALEACIQTMAQVGEEVRQVPLMSVATAAMGWRRLWIARQYQRVKNVLAAPGYR